MGEAGEDRPLFRDIRRYYCDFCGICRSKKSLIASHVLADHKEELESTMSESDSTEESRKSNTCEQCGATFKKPAHLKQHMASHSIERPHTCPINDCPASYRRKDHLNRHLLSHKGKLFKCSVENCNIEFVTKSNMKKHVKDKHDENRESTSKSSDICVCQEAGCGKAFIYPSKLQKHEDSHVKLESVEALCPVPGCMKLFTNSQCLKEHNQTCHQHIICEICGTKQIKRNIKRHMRTHEEKGQSEQQINCTYKDCGCKFSTKSNLNKHVKAVHFKDKPFVCGIPGCGARFSYKHVRDKHEKNGGHVYAHGDFVEADEQFRSRPRGGRKRKYPTVEMLVRKRVTPPNVLDDSFDFFSSEAYSSS